MYLVDFIFGNHRLSDLGMIVCNINKTANETTSMGSILLMNNIQNKTNFTNEIINISYDTPITATFDIARNDCMMPEQMEIQPNEIRFIMKWLNQKKNTIFKPLYNDYTFDDVFYRGSFTDISEVTIGGKVVGFTLTFTSNAPFGFLDNVKESRFGDVANWSFKYYANSDEIGYLYTTKFQFTCGQAGNLKISNDKDRLQYYTYVANCEKGETITFDSVHKVITSSRGHQNLYNDFNYLFPRFVEQEEYDWNTITCSLPGQLYFECEPIRKVGIL